MNASVKPGIIPLVLVGFFLLFAGIMIGVRREPQDTPESSIENHEAASEAITRLHLNDCTPPCWAFIEPGSATMNMVKTRVSSAFPDFEIMADSTNYMAWQFREADQLRTFISAQFQNELLTSLEVASDVGSSVMPTLAEALATYGTPACIIFSDDTEWVGLFYENGSGETTLRFSVAAATLKSRVLALTFGTRSDVPCQNRMAMSWNGFLGSERSSRLYS